jgi:hypothetical protein
MMWGSNAYGSCWWHEMVVEGLVNLVIELVTSL